MKTLKKHLNFLISVVLVLNFLPLSSLAETIKSDFFSSTTEAQIQEIAGEYTANDTIWLNCALPDGYKNAQLSVGEKVVKRFYGVIENAGSYSTKIDLSELSVAGDNIPVALKVTASDGTVCEKKSYINIKNTAGDGSVYSPFITDTTVEQITTGNKKSIVVKLTLSEPLDEATVNENSVFLYINGKKVSPTVLTESNGKIIKLSLNEQIYYPNAKVVIDTTVREKTYGQNIDKQLVSTFNIDIPQNTRSQEEKLSSIVIEAEDMIYGWNMLVADDTQASGGKALKQKSDGLKEENNYDYMTEFNIQIASKYNVWMRVKSSSGSNLCYKTGKTNDYGKAQAINSSTTYVWKEIATGLVFNKGLNSLFFKHDSYGGASIDKIIITSDNDFTPTEIDSLPGSNVIRSFDISNVTAYPQKGVHPRLYVTADDIPKIKERCKSPLFSVAYENIKSNASKEIDCLFKPGHTEYQENSVYLDIIQAKAFMFLIGEHNEAQAKELIKDTLNLMETMTYETGQSGSSTRFQEFVIGVAACVYDWCYTELTAADKKHFINLFYSIAESTSMRFPPVGRSGNFIYGYGTENSTYRDFLAAGIAIYDEDEEWYNAAASVLFDNLIPPKVFFTSSGNDATSSAYGVRNENNMYAEQMIKKLGYDSNLFGDKYANIFYKQLYNKLPNGYWMKDGDDTTWAGATATERRCPHYDMLMRYSGSEYKNPYTMREGMINLALTPERATMFDILFVDETSQTADVTALPLTNYTTYPLTSMTARTSWQNGIASPTAMVTMNMRDITIGDHQHADVGSFQFYYKGMLALDSGIYDDWGGDHQKNYSTRSVAHNVIVLEDPDKTDYETYISDGGQKNHHIDGGILSKFTLEEVTTSEIPKTAKEKAHYIGPNKTTPEFSYVSSDISYAYNSELVSEGNYERSMVFLNLFDETYPAALIVYDNLKTNDSNQTKKWLIHSEEEPQHEETTNKTVLTRTDSGYNGKLVNNTLLPKNAQYEKVGGAGKEFWAGGQNWQPSASLNINSKKSDSGNWRMEISPSVKAAEDLFLNVMYVTDADGNAQDIPVQLVEEDLYVGASFMDRLVTFSKSNNNISTAFDLSVENDTEDVSCLITDVAEGVWVVSGENGNTVRVRSKENENCLYFNVAPGKYKVTPAANGVEADIINYPVLLEEDFGDFVIMKDRNLMYLPKPTKLVGSTAYIAVDGILTQLGAEITSADENKVSINFKNKKIEITANSEDYTVDNTPKKFENVPILYKGSIYVNPIELQDVFGWKSVSYNDLGKVLILKTS